MRKYFEIAQTLFLCLALVFSAKVSRATAPGGTAAPFLKIGPGARAVGMGESFVGLADDVTTLYWNPSGLANLTKWEATFMHASWFQSINYEYMAVGLPGGALPFLGNVGTAGVSLIFLNTGDIPETFADPTSTAGFSSTGSNIAASDMLITVGYGRPLDSRLKVGGAIKFVNQSVGGGTVDPSRGLDNSSLSAWAFAMDLGLLADTDIENLRIGVVVQNLGTQVKLENDAFPLPLQFKVGAGWKIPQKNVTFVSDIIQPIDNKTSWNSGVEYYSKYKFAELILRLGYRFQFASPDPDVITGVTAGVGAVVFGSIIDYAFEPYGELGNTHRISLSFKW